MSELIDNNKQKRVDMMKVLVRKLHEEDGENSEKIKLQLETLLDKADYADVFAMEIQLIEEGIPQENIAKLCDTHTHVLRSQLDAQETPKTIPGHPVHTFMQENIAITEKTGMVKLLITEIEASTNEDALPKMREIQQHLNDLMDVDKHYRRKENLLFPFFEKNDKPGPPAVMWGKDDEVRDLLKTTISGLQQIDAISKSEAVAYNEMAVMPTMLATEEMIYKEEKIMFPIALDMLTETEWYEVYVQTDEIGFCLYVPEFKWTPSDNVDIDEIKLENIGGKVQMPTGSFTVEELISMFSVFPFDITFVDKNDDVRFFSNSPDRVFDRNRAILGRKVQYCHPPSSVHIVNKILEDFKSGTQNVAKFWIQMGPKLIYIVYYALRDKDGGYNGTLEVTQDISEIKALEGEQRLLSYE
jgi:uncharacterized protein